MFRSLFASFVAIALLEMTATAQSSPILIDFGPTSTATPAPGAGEDFWNNLTSINPDTPIALRDSQNAATLVTLGVTDTFQGTNPTGSTSVPGYPASASRDSFYGQDGTNPTAALKLTGLDPTLQYDLTFLASRVNVSPADDRTTAFTVQGVAAPVTVFLNATNNVDTRVTAPLVVPTASGELTISLQKGPTNNSVQGFYYLNTLAIDVPEPGSMGLMGLGTLLVAARRR